MDRETSKQVERRTFFVALTGNPNSGKTTVFNALTGLRAKVGNYPGVTVERKEGKLKGTPADKEVVVLDLPGTYSMSSKSLDEQVARDILLNRIKEIPVPSAIIIVIDASNLQRNLYYATQVIELGYPVILALNMMDVAAQNGQLINIDKLSRFLNVPIIPMVASKKEGITALRQSIIEIVSQIGNVGSIGDEKEIRGKQGIRNEGLFVQKRDLFWKMPVVYRAEIQKIAAMLEDLGTRVINPEAESLLILTDDAALGKPGEFYTEEVVAAVYDARKRIESSGGDWKTDPIEGRYELISKIYSETTTQLLTVEETFSDRLDRIITHRFWGIVIFLMIMLVMFQSIFRLAKIPMEFLSSVVERLGQWVLEIMPPGALTDLLTDGVIAGVGAVVVFLPQILLLFLFLSLLEDTGYMSRAAFIMDRIMGKVGLHGKAFIPLLSSFACAIPGIMAARTIESHKDRLVTILIAPLMSCSARLPVYTVLISACIPDIKVFGFFRLQGLVLMGAYLLGIILALMMAFIFKKTILKGDIPMLLMELPPYKKPAVWTTMHHMWDRSIIFLKQAGTIILAINIVLWFLMSYPKGDVEKEYAVRRTETIKKYYGTNLMMETIEQLRTNMVETSTIDKEGVEKAKRELAEIDKEESIERLSKSFAGMLGKAIEPVIAPLGFDWKIGIGIVSSFAARETFVSTMAVIYNVGSDKEETSAVSVANAFKEQKRGDGTKLFTPLTGITLIIFYICALQCASTVVVVRRETNSWKWTVFQWFYLGALAWTLSFLTRSIGKMLGYY
ncbi:MAG: ferrous iron transport protein B [Verrucomicrobiae bacterium]|nr:ferrous iron transport protein B [Verrucomicrobiae bacterium]